MRLCFRASLVLKNVFRESEYQILGRRTGRKQNGLGKFTTPIKAGWKAVRQVCVVLCFNFSSA